MLTIRAVFTSAGGMLPITRPSDASGGRTSGLRRATGYWNPGRLPGRFDDQTCSGLSRLVSILTPGPMVELTLIFFR
jgi:hypothetical protein